MAHHPDMRFRLDPVQWHLPPVPTDDDIAAESARVQALIGPRTAPASVQVLRGLPKIVDSCASKGAGEIRYGLPHGYPRERVAVTIAHEVAHVVVGATPDDETGHGEAWSRMFLCALDLAYGIVLLTPLSGPIGKLSGGIADALGAAPDRPCELTLARRRSSLPKWRARAR